MSPLPFRNYKAICGFRKGKDLTSLSLFWKEGAPHPTPLLSKEREMSAEACRAGGVDFFEISLLNLIRFSLNALQTFAGQAIKNTLRNSVFLNKNGCFSLELVL